MTSKSIEQKYRKLDEIAHVRQRPGMYVGSIAMHESLDWVYDLVAKTMYKKQVTYNPGLVKIFAEILDNSIDEHKRHPEKLDVIKVDIEADGTISIYDNGGIPVELHKGENQYVPEMIFSELRSGSNFNDEDDQALIGTNGVGSCLTNILSTRFLIETCDGKKSYTQEFSNGMRDKTEPKIKSHAKNFTRITFKPDYEYFKTELTEDNRLKIIKRVIDAAGNNSKIKFYLNGERIHISSFQDYVQLYGTEFEFEEDDNWKIAVGMSDVGFDQISFVNSVETYSGGTHVEYIYLQIAQALRAFFLKKHKVEVKPSDIKQHLRLFISASINRPKFSSQTKENMISEIKDYGSRFSVSDKFIAKLSKSNVIKAVLDWVAAKQLMAERAALRELDKDTAKQDPNRVPKFCDATEKKDRTKCMLFITEGDTIHEDEKIVVYEDDTFFDKAIKHISIGDSVLTHLNRLKKVVGISKKMIEGIRITCGDIVHTVSPIHRLLAYDLATREIIEVAAQDLDPSRHSLVKNRIVDASHLSKILDINECDSDQYDLTIDIEHCGEVYSSNGHKFYVWDSSALSFKLVAAAELCKDIHFVVLLF